MGVNHGGGTGERRVPSPRIWNEGDANADCPHPRADFVMFQKLQAPDFLHYDAVNAVRCIVIV